MTTLPGLTRSLPAVYQKTSVLRRLSWVLAVLPFTALWVLVWIAVCIGTLAVFGVNNGFCWLAWGGDWDEHATESIGVPFLYWTEYGWNNARSFLLSQKWPIDWRTSDDRSQAAKVLPLQTRVPAAYRNHNSYDDDYPYR